ncbi:hypothetical protein [Frankia sp. Cj5]|uniref:PD-(D/E)XK nuclease domain-containing protein n=1 Tax=Frankia sp. Cj5 TaxID=2880978 RepID=UPI001EF67C5A|nr:hypothetical protein [Frankia sp. Cj5]
MGSRETRRQAIESLIAESEKLEKLFLEWQEGDEPSPDEISKGRREYMSWYTRARPFVPDSDRAKFENMYEGGALIARVKGFLADPRKEYQLYNPEQPNTLPRWQVTFDSFPRKGMVEQRDVLERTLHEGDAIEPVLSDLAEIFRRLPAFIDVLGSADNERVPQPTLTNEADLQDLTHAILRLHYDDVRPEDPVPKRAGRASRVDFLLREAGVLVETKFTRPDLRDKKVCDELLHDMGRYPRHPDCEAIFAAIYDPGRYIVNPAMIEKDLPQSSVLPFRAVIVR